MMKAVFLAAGVGKRFVPILKDKCLLKFCGRELILRQIDAIHGAGIADIVVVCSPGNSEPIRELVGDRARYAVQETPTGMAGALLAARDLVGDEAMLVVNADDVFDASLYREVVAAGEQGVDACIAAYEVAAYFPGGYLIVDGDHVRGIVEKPGAGQEPSNLVNIVVHLHRDTQTLFATLDADTQGGDDVYERAMDAMIGAGKQFRVVPYRGFWGPLKYPWHILAVARHYIDQEPPRVDPTAQVHATAEINGHVVIEAGARVFQNAVINGPAYIGRQAIVGNGALVRDGTDLEARSVVGYSTEVKTAYIGEDCWFHTNYVGDSVIMDRCAMGSGAVTANLRLDEQAIKVTIGDQRIDTGTNKLGVIMGEGARLGVQASTMPGVRVGAGAMVGAGVCLREDLAAGKMLLLRQETALRDAPAADSASREAMMKKLAPR